MKLDKIQSLKERALELAHAKKETTPNVACMVVYVEKCATNLLLNDPTPISRAKLAKLIHEGRILSTCEVDGVVAYRVLVSA